MFSRFVVLFDASVFYSAPVRDLFIELALAEFYRAKWTNQIHDEWIENLLRKRPDLKRKNLEKTRQLINEAVDDCVVKNYEGLIRGLRLPDKNDCHVLAAAIKCKAQIIVTYNLKDFPSKILSKFDVEAMHPDDFFLNQMDLNKGTFLATIKMIRKSLKNPPKSSKEYLFSLRKHALKKTADKLEDFLGEI
ncbi:MAG: PIN domain-containing protein [Verrucomicrobia bacterium]|nr:PIN domain-containing protein [Verrucomicrobiota bacterium]